MSYDPLITFITTLGRNPGDEWIREGIRAVLDRLGPYRPAYVCKHDRDSLGAPREDEAEEIGNKVARADLVILAGGPVFWRLWGGASSSVTADWHPWLMRGHLLGTAGPPLAVLGAGSCDPWAGDGSEFLADPACAGFARDLTDRAELVTVRDPIAGQILRRLAIPYHELPCPAFLAARRHTPRPAAGSPVIAVNIMAGGGHHATDAAFSAEAWRVGAAEICAGLRRLGRIVWVAHDHAEASLAAGLRGPGERVFGPAPWRDYLDVYAGCSLVVANRVHAVVLAAGWGVPGVVIGNDTRARMVDVLGLPRFEAGHADPAAVVTEARRLLEDAAVQELRLLSLRADTVGRYVNLLGPIYGRARARKEET